MDWLKRAQRPLILAGGGARHAASGIAKLSARLGAPVVMTTNGRGVLGADHPLSVPASPSLEVVRRLIGDADVTLAVGTEIGRTDYDIYDRSPVVVPGRLIRIDIDPEQLTRGVTPDISIVGDSAKGISAVVAALGDGAPTPDGATRAAAARRAARNEAGSDYESSIRFLEMVRDALPSFPIVGDSTQAIYAGNLFFAASAPNRWFNAATGYGWLGYGLPEAIGAARASGGPVVCIAGDGGLQFTLTEIGCAVEERLPVILLVWNNRGYGEIKNYMLSRQITPVGVDLHTPDFVAIAKTYGAAGIHMHALDQLPKLLAEAAARTGPTLIEFDEMVVARA